jgi:hypothetical protein
LLLDILRDLLTLRHVEELTSFVSLVPLQPWVFAMVESIKRSSDNLQGFSFLANSHYLTRFNLVRRDVNYLAIYSDVAVANELTSSSASRSHTKAIYYVVETRLQELEKDLTSNTFDT